MGHLQLLHENPKDSLGFQVLSLPCLCFTPSHLQVQGRNMLERAGSSGITKCLPSAASEQRQIGPGLCWAAPDILSQSERAGEVQAEVPVKAR